MYAHRIGSRKIDMLGILRMICAASEVAARLA
jgi:hypothetical protein